MAHALVTFTSDFGHDDWFVGVVHGVIGALAPGVTVVDLNHAIPPGDVARGAFILEAASGDFPPGTVHLAVVDPGVGTARRALAVAARGQYFVGPDNGLLEWALEAPGAEAHVLTEERWFRRPVSRTFHGRDVFAPAAAAITLGAPIEQLGTPVEAPLCLQWPQPHVDEHGRLVGEVLAIDRFGNALTNLPGPSRPARMSFDACELPVCRTYADVEPGQPLALTGSSGCLEIAVREGSAALRFALRRGTRVVLIPGGA